MVSIRGQRGGRGGWNSLGLELFLYDFVIGSSFCLTAYRKGLMFRNCWFFVTKYDPGGCVVINCLFRFAVAEVRFFSESLLLADGSKQTCWAQWLGSWQDPVAPCKV